MIEIFKTNIIFISLLIVVGINGQIPEGKQVEKVELTLTFNSGTFPNEHLNVYITDDEGNFQKIISDRLPVRISSNDRIDYKFSIFKNVLTDILVELPDRNISDIQRIKFSSDVYILVSSISDRILFSTSDSPFLFE